MTQDTIILYLASTSYNIVGLQVTMRETTNHKQIRQGTNSKQKLLT